MKRGNIIFVVIITAVLSNACDKIINVQIPGGEKLLVVNATFCPDSIISASLSKSQNILDGSKIAYINNANIYVYNEYELIDTLRNSGNGIFVGHLKPFAEQQYSMKIIVPGYALLQAIDTIPNIVSIQQIDTSAVINGTSEILNCSINFTDPANEANYYLLRILSAYIANPKNIQAQKYTCYDPMITQSGDVYDTLAGGNIIGFDDSQINGRPHSLSVSMSYPKNKIVYFQLWSISRAFYKYCYTISDNRQNSYGLFSSPVQVIGNINGGLGIMAAYVISTDSIVFK